MTLGVPVMNLKAVKFHPGPETAAKEAKSMMLVLSMPPEELLETVLSNTMNIRARGRNRRKEEKWS